MSVCMGDLGDDQKEWIFEPFETPAPVEPERAPAPVEPEKVPVPA